MQMVKHKPRSDTKNKDGEAVMVDENLDAQVKVKLSRSSKRNVRAVNLIFIKYPFYKSWNKIFTIYLYNYRFDVLDFFKTFTIDN